MTPEEYNLLFHRAQVNLVAFKQVFYCDDELRKMVEMAVAAEREACAKVCEFEWSNAVERSFSEQCAAIIRGREARGNT